MEDLVTTTFAETQTTPRQSGATQKIKTRDTIGASQ